MRKRAGNMGRATIKDVAKQAGVSITTVSHALSGGGVVKQETRERVREIARQMNYMPNWNGKKLKSSETKIIGFFVKYIRGFYGKIADAMHETCKELGYELDIIIVDDGSTILNNLMSHRVDGAVILHDNFREKEAEVLVNSGLPAVFLDRELVAPRVSSVIFDSFATGYQAAQYLYGLGHRHMMLVDGKRTYDGLERSRGFLSYLAEKGIQFDPAYQIYGGFDRNEAFHAMEAFLASRLPMPTAVFAANDDSAFGCMTALANAGYSVPEDISIMGCDNIELSQWLVPSLTTMDTSISKQGRIVAEEIVALVKGTQSGHLSKTLGKLIERNSCIAIK